jgi:hypothetical protein
MSHKNLCQLMRERVPCAKVFLRTGYNVVYFLYNESDFIVVEKAGGGYQATKTFDCRTQRRLAHQSEDQNAQHLILEREEENFFTVGFYKCRVAKSCDEGREER